MGQKELSTVDPFFQGSVAGGVFSFECSRVLAEHLDSTIFTGFPQEKKQASVAQLAEQLICNQQVVGSNPSAGSVIPLSWQTDALYRAEQEGPGRIENAFNPALMRQ